MTKLLTTPFTQLCCWQGTVVGQNNITSFEKWMMETFGVRVLYATETETNPDHTGPGGRNDLLFYVHKDDVTRFAIRRLEYEIRWWEDVIKYNNNAGLYKMEILKQYLPTW